MCGICGVYEFKNIGKVDSDVLIRMRDTLVHRGPDDADIYLSGSGNVGLGHRRLSIVDLSENGRQPMTNAAEDLWIVFNGEIYNHEKLRVDLEKKGYNYHSGTDTETLLYLYQEYGQDCLDLLEGMFAFAIWDAKTEKLFVARDRLGIKPFYYTYQDGRFMFASEPKALLEHPSIKAELDEKALYHFVSFICTPAPYTLMKGIYKLEPATCMQIGEDGIDFKRRYWTPIEKNNNDVISEADYVRKIDSLLGEATEKRMMSDVPFGAFLSGGIDSSLNVAYMSEMLDRPVDTFTVGFSTPGSEQFNEFAPAKVVAEKFNSNHQEIAFDTDSILSELDSFMEHQDDLVAHPVCVPFYMMSKATKEAGITVVQVGEGSDEFFIGYERFMSDLKTTDGWKWPLYNRLPRFFKNLAYQIDKVLYEVKNPGKQNYFRPGQEYLRRAANGEELFWGGLLCFPEDLKVELFTDEFQSRNKGLDTYRDVLAPMYDEISKEFPDADQTQRMSYIEMQLRLPEHLLMRVDRMSMASSLEARVPFLDHKLVELVFNMPRDIKLRDGAKSALKKASRGRIPDEIIDRRKQGFAAPANNWFKNMPEEFERALLYSPLSQAGVLKLEFLENMVERVKKQGGWDLHAWSIFMLAKWYERWIVNAK